MGRKWPAGTAGEGDCHSWEPGRFSERLVAVGSDLRFFGSVGSPSLLVEGITISGE